MAIRNFNRVNSLDIQHKGDVGDIDFGHFDSFPFVKIVGIVAWEVGRGKNSTFWKALIERLLSGSSEQAQTTEKCSGIDSKAHRAPHVRILLTLQESFHHASSQCVIRASDGSSPIIPTGTLTLFELT